MSRRATTGTSLGTLIQMAIPLCQAAQRQCPRTGPGRPPEFEDWQMAVLIMIAVLKKKKSKSAQHRYLKQHQEELCGKLDLKRLPGRSTYCQRYKRAHRIFAAALRLQGGKALQEHRACADSVAADKSLIPARGPCWHKHDRKKGKVRRGTDQEAGWSYSQHDGWVWGYSYEVVVCATRKSTVFPLLASADTASCSEHRSFAAKVSNLPKSTRFVLLDGGYDDNALAEAVEWRPSGRRSGKRYVCPLQARGGKPAVGTMVHRGRRERSRQRRASRDRFYHSRRGRQLYPRRKKSSEPFNQWFKATFELQDHVWHRGLDNNRTMILAALFGYQLLLRYNRLCKRRDQQVQWILDGL